MKIAVIGGGINGLCSAWLLAQEGHQVSLYEKGKLMSATSMASSKLLHGGLRYLEQYQFSLVHEALQERKWWLEQVPGLTRRLPLLYPLYQGLSRPRWKLKLGLTLYDVLAANRGIGRHRWLSPQQMLHCSPTLNPKGLKGGYLFFDGQMDDQALGLWVAERCKELGVGIFEQSPVSKVDIEGHLELQGKQERFDLIVNAAGPWSSQLLQRSGLQAPQQLDLVRGSHLLLPPMGRYGHMLEVPGEKRIVFVLPYQNKTLLGTTEVRQSADEPIRCSDQERRYLLNLFNHYFSNHMGEDDILQEYAGVRPLLGGSEDASHASREYRLVRQGQLLTIFGGKWTTARALASAVVKKLNK
ncbi:glycerol-3-phosphate dehydrogenase/oxidase [Aliiglaciecola sp. CAU 1673]|uniref:glycerol-3-phosphate dehydrogenase/oxidase n=1 Tax=Aliiglaciecola sp. CAU 1673 TaxID=3032595 RepID=UPI0023DB2420|nr:glycerol-3-phosphate dehydrogenase/oxidase [Aliiglaciecola sp. CAU 1673]MDF2177116.1 glycerol-3-phosphate dehydrogenase/oxidase [Aliiglaciecola sp. CAU 1673]